MRNKIRKLFDKYHPTKFRVNYEVPYWQHFKDRRYTTKSILEIGVQTGASLLAWHDFFPNARIFGIDCDQQCEKLNKNDNRIVVKIGEQQDVEFLKKINKQAGGFDIVIDDGSHVPQHQITSFETLFPLMRDNGIYVVEDMTPGFDAVDYFAKLTRNLNYYEPTARWHDLSYFKGGNYYDNNIIAIYFYRYICFVHKGHNPDNPYLDIID
jgi:hypothetical protein